MQQAHSTPNILGLLQLLCGRQTQWGVRWSPAFCPLKKHHSHCPLLRTPHVPKDTSTSLCYHRIPTAKTRVTLHTQQEAQASLLAKASLRLEWEVPKETRFHPSSHLVAAVLGQSRELS